MEFEGSPDPVLARRVMEILPDFVGPLKFSHLLNLLNVNPDYPRTRRGHLSKVLQWLVSKNLVIRLANTSSYIDKRESMEEIACGM